MEMQINMTNKSKNDCKIFVKKIINPSVRTTVLSLMIFSGHELLISTLFEFLNKFKSIRNIQITY